MKESEGRGRGESLTIFTDITNQMHDLLNTWGMLGCVCMGGGGTVIIVYKQSICGFSWCSHERVPSPWIAASCTSQQDH